ncbi:hypothetical protein [Bacillus wiedmannii]|uniref:GAP1-N2 domain-containing protein n=1 Tax=Bacillus wiedmannii TaxID=1890302 RepID=UPI003D96DF84
MGIRQHYYTSSKYGFFGGSGFQTYSMTEGITESQLQDIERYGVYIQAKHLPMQPSEEEIALLFPSLFTFYPVENGAYALSLSNYVGRDYSGRYGNYFCHTFLLNQEQFKHYPIEYYGSNAFKRKLSNEEEHINERPAPLPEISHLSPGEKITKQSVSKFLKSGDRYEHLRHMLHAVRKFEVEKRSVIIVDELEHIPFWFAAIQMSFPLDIAIQLSFSTYTHDPMRSDSMIISIMKEDGGHYSDAFMNHQFYVFDFENKMFSHVEETDLYAEHVAGIWEKEDAFDALFSYVAKIGASKVNDELDVAINLYRLLEQKDPALSVAESVKALRFAKQQCDTATCSQMVMKVINNWEEDEAQLQTISLQLSTSDAEFLTRLFLETGTLVKQEKVLKFAAKLFYLILDQFIIDGKIEENEQEVTRYIKNGKSVNGVMQVLYQSATKPKRLEDLLAYLKVEPSQEKITFYLRDILSYDSIEINPHVKKWIVQVLRIAIDKQFHLATLFSVIGKRPEVFSNIFSEVSRACPAAYQTEIEDSFFEYIMKSKNQEELLPVVIEDTKLKSMVVKGIEAKLMKAHAPFTTFQVLESSWLSETLLPKRFIDKMGKKIVEIQEFETFVSELKLAFSTRFLSHISRVTLEDLIEDFETRVPLDEKVHQYLEIISQIEKIKVSKEIETTPDIVGMIKFSIELERAKRMPYKTQERMTKHLILLQEQQYKEYIANCIPKLLPLFVREKYDSLLDSLYTQHREHIVCEILCQLDANFKKEQVDLIAAFLNYICKEEKIHESVLEEVSSQMTLFLKDNKGIYKKINEEVVRLPAYAKSDRLQRTWKGIQLNVIQERSIVEKVKGLFKFR